MFDLAVIVVVSTFLLVGFVRGFLKEFFGLIGIIVSIIITVHNYDVFILLLDIRRSILTNVLSTVAAYVVVLIIIMIFNAMLMSAIKSIRYSTLDRIFGILMGTFKGVSVSYILIFLIQLFYFSLYINTENDMLHKEKFLPIWLVRSHVYPIFTQLDHLLDSILPEDFYDDLKIFGKSLAESMEKDVEIENDKKKSHANTKILRKGRNDL